MDKIEELEKKIQELEKKINQSTSNLFGRSYSQVGSPTSDFIIKTRGQVKIQWGNKFIDLIKDGKINVDSKVIFKGNVGAKDGIYVTEDGSIYLKVGNSEPINLLGEVGTTYVSFMGEQETDSESKHTALKNIGLLYPNFSSINSSSLRNGIIYIEDEQKLYTVKEGNLTEFSVKFPNPFTEQFILAKNDLDIGSIYIKGTGIQNSLAFESFYIFDKDGTSTIKVNKGLNIEGEDNTYINIEKVSSTFKHPIKVDTITSIGGDYDSGFMLYRNDNGHTLTLDNLMVRNGEDPGEDLKGLYAKQGYFEKASYAENTDSLPIEDCSKNFASTEWVKSLLPIGTIIAFHGAIEDIPAGWHICNGEQGTPNLINKFIKGGEVSGETGGSNEITITEANLPPHSHNASTTVELTKGEDTPPVVDESLSEQYIPTQGELYFQVFDLGGDKHYTIESGYEEATDKGLKAISVQSLVDISNSGTPGEYSASATTTIENTGIGESLAIEPSYYTLIYIMKIS